MSATDRHPLLRVLIWVLGSILVFVAIAMGVAALVALAHQELAVSGQIGLAAAPTFVSGILGRRLVKRPSGVTVRQGFVAVGLAWFVFSIFGALPYLFTGAIPGPVDAFFETASGFTTSGATVISDPSTLPAGILFWRVLTQWLGGLGVIVLGVAVLPTLGTGGMQLTRAESSGLSTERLTPKFQGTALRYWMVYAGLTLTSFILLAVGEMQPFEALLHALATVSTGGFSTTTQSVAVFGAYTKWVLIVFMFLGGISFALHFRALRDPGAYWRNAEFRIYFTLLVVASVLITGGLWAEMGPADAAMEGVFTSVALLTTTGFTSSDFGEWRPALQVLVVGLMFLGGMSGSTSGGIKSFRVGVLTKAAYADLRRLVHPRGVFAVRLGRRKVPDPVVESVQSFFLFYMLIFMVSTFLLTFIDANMGEDLDLITSTSAVASAMSNLGSGLGDVGPSGNHAFLPAPAKLLLSGLMILGRLEIFPVLVLFTRDLWRR
ncbi:MAG TPA: TrkH family potassium uptake protein [Acidimicrobiia bacterium]